MRAWSCQTYEASKGFSTYGTLDDAFEQMEHERYAAAGRAWGTAQYHPRQPMVDWISTLRKLKLELKEPKSASRGPHGRFLRRVGSGVVGAHAQPRRTSDVDEPDHELKGNALDAIDEVDTESTIASEGACPEVIDVEQDVEQ